LAKRVRKEGRLLTLIHRSQEGQQVSDLTQPSFVLQTPTVMATVIPDCSSTHDHIEIPRGRNKLSLHLLLPSKWRTFPEGLFISANILLQFSCPSWGACPPLVNPHYRDFKLSSWATKRKDHHDC
jgi:hypothetical protein